MRTLHFALSFRACPPWRADATSIERACLPQAGIRIWLWLCSAEYRGLCDTLRLFGLGSFPSLANRWLTRDRQRFLFGTRGFLVDLSVFHCNTRRKLLWSTDVTKN